MSGVVFCCGWYRGGCAGCRGGAGCEGLVLLARSECSGATLVSLYLTTRPTAHSRRAASLSSSSNPTFAYLHPVPNIHVKRPLSAVARDADNPLQVSDSTGFGSGGTSGAVTVQSSNDASCFDPHTQVSPLFAFSIVPSGAVTQCSASRIWWDPSVVQGCVSLPRSFRSLLILATAHLRSKVSFPVVSPSAYLKDRLALCHNKALDSAGHHPFEQAQLCYCWEATIADPERRAARCILSTRATTLVSVI